MTSKEKINRLLGKSPFGLTPREVSLRVRVNEKSATRLLDDMAKKKKVIKTKAGDVYFYRIAIIFMLLLLPVHAQNFSSTSYQITATVIDSVGGNITDPSNRTLVTSAGQVSGRRSSENYELCAGFLCSFYDVISRGRVAFMLTFNISGNENDKAFVDAYEEPGTYNAEQLFNYYACLQDTSQTGSPTFGIISAGSYLGYIKVVPSSSYTMRVSEDIPGNKFIIPVTSGNCTIFNTRIPQIAQYGTILQPFVIISEAINAVELALDYQAFQIAGNFDRTGHFKLIIEKNLTNEKQIIIKPE